MTNVVSHVVVRGRVQGVGYRAFVEQEASQRGLAGWVRNRRDGTVEAVFSGSAATVEAVIETCRKGPPGSHVDGIEINDGRADNVGPHRQFAVLPTV